MYDPFVEFACDMGGGVGWQESQTGFNDGRVDYWTSE